MTYYLNKIVWFFANPFSAALFCALVGGVLAFRTRSRRYIAPVLVLVASVWIMATPAFLALVGLPLERPYLATQKAESLPEADAIVVLGGGMRGSERTSYADLVDGSDRVWHAARLWKAGRAPKIVLTGAGSTWTTKGFLLDLGVPESAILGEAASRNTREDAKTTEALLGKGAKVLVVTSAWHMTRALGNFEATSLVTVPAATDFAATDLVDGVRHWFDWIMPDTEMLMTSVRMLHEWLGRLARK